MVLPAIFAGVSAVASIAGGISASQQASKQNEQAAANADAQQAAAQRSAAIQNEYNQRVFEAEKENYYNFRKYEYDTAVRSWQYNQSLQDYQYLQAVDQYSASIDNTRNQLTYNNIAAIQARESEQAALNEIMTEDAFTREGLLVDQLKAEGKAGLGQAGRSRTKALQSTIAELGRNTAVMDASLSSSVEQMQRNMRDIGLRKFGADEQARASMMIRPEMLPDIPAPTMAPERIFVEPMEVQAQYVPQPIRQNTLAPILGGISSGFSALSQVDFGSPGEVPPPTNNPYAGTSVPSYFSNPSFGVGNSSFSGSVLSTGNRGGPLF
jgi:hypothetical protein